MTAPFKCLLVAALAATVVNGHGYLSDPKVKFTAQAGDPTQFIATIQASASGLPGTFNGAPKDNVAAFTKAFGASKYKSLKEFVNDKAKVQVSGATMTCGSCDPKQTPQPMPKTDVVWSHSDSEGFTPSHEGPCEVWCDDVRTFQDDDCAANYKMVPAKMPFDRDACMGSSTLTFFWMAMHSDTWQVYVNCSPLEKTTGTGAKSKYAVGSASSSPTQSNSTSSSTTDSSSAESPAAQTPSSGGSPSTTSTESSSAGSPATQAPSSGDSPSTPSPESPSAGTPPAETPSSGGSPSTPSPESPSAGTPPAETPSSGGSPSTPTTDASSDCGSYDVAGSSDCGSYDVAGSSDCGSYDVAGGSGDDKQNSGTTGGNSYQQGGDNNNQQQQQQQQQNNGGNTGTGSQQNNGGMDTWSKQNNGGKTDTGSLNNFDFSVVQGNTNVGTVAPYN